MPNSMRCSEPASTGADDLRLILWLLAQCIGYHPLMWYVITKSIFTALRGRAVGWNKFARAGASEMGGDGATRAGAELAAAPAVVVSG